MNNLQSESKFGDPEAIIEIMKSAENLVVLGDIDDLESDIPPHTNKVEMAGASIRAGQKPHVNEILKVSIQAPKGKQLLCIFKPGEGENRQVKEQHDIQDFSFCIHERAAYLIDRHFNFDLIPPTLVKTIDGRIGALQLFLEHNKHKNPRNLNDEEFGAMCQSEDWQKMALLDWLLANCERHNDNIMMDRKNPTQLFAIDHGICLLTKLYHRLALRGPSHQLTFDNQKKESLQTPIPFWLLSQIAIGLKRCPILEKQLLDLGIEKQEVDEIKKRCQAVLEKKYFLSKENHVA